MSRLQRHQQKRILFYSGIILVGLFLLFYFGLPLFINGSVYVANLFSKKTSVPNNSTQSFRDIQLINVPEATNSASVIISGNITNFDSVDFFLNGNNVKETQPDSSGKFSQQIDGLNSGNNQLYAVGKISGSSDTKQTSTYNILSKNSKPNLDISQPADNLKTNKTEITVSGKTDNDAEIKINGIPVVVGASGNFQATVKLSNGDNKITVTSSDKAGNTAEKTLTVNYSPDN